MSHVDEGTLHALVDDALDDTERAAVEAHLAVCGECARQFAEATAMARQVSTLLEALDAPAPAVRVVSPAPPPVPTPVTPLRPRGVTLRRVAMAASLLVVAGVSYRVGTSRPAADVAVMDSAVSRRTTAAPMRAVPSVVEAAPEAFAAAPVPSVRQRPASGPRSESDAASPATGAAAAEAPAAPRAIAMPVPMPAPAVAEATPTQAMGRVVAQAGAGRVADAAADRAEGASQDQRASAGAAPTPSQAAVQAALASASQNASQPASPPESRRRMERPLELSQVVVTGASASAEKSTAPKATPLAGYVVSEDASTPAVTRRSYVSSSGTAVVLSIVQPVGAPKAARAAASSEFIVTTIGGRSTVRWSIGGTEYTLQGALAPDSLVKLATLLKP
jgi:Putative zinc-finger